MSITLEEAQRHYKTLESKGESVGYYADVFADKARTISDFYKSGKMSANQAVSMIGGFIVARHKPTGVAVADWKKNVLKQSTVLSKKYEDLARYLNGNPSDVGGELLRLRASLPTKSLEASDVIKKGQDDAVVMESVAVYSATEAIALVEIANRYLSKAGVKPVELKVSLLVAS